ncbi:hypothetical protein NIO33_004064 [Salmonella enterica]|nr:hypothetical protein [Salmonella enterica]
MSAINKKYSILLLLLLSNCAYSMQCSLNGEEVTEKVVNVIPNGIDINTVDGYYTKSVTRTFTNGSFIKCKQAGANQDGRNIRVGHRASSMNLCLRGYTEVTSANRVRRANWNHADGMRIHPVFQTERANRQYTHKSTRFTLEACNPNVKIPEGRHNIDIVALSWQRVGNVRKIRFKTIVNVKNTVSKASCKIFNKSNATISFNRLVAGTGVHHGYYDAQIHCDKPTSFKYRLHSPSPTISSLPLPETDSSKYLGVGLGPVNSSLWITAQNNNPRALSGTLNSSTNAYIRINSIINTNGEYIKNTGGLLNGSAVLEINVD